MIKDIYSREENSAKYDPSRLEVDDALSQLIVKIENTLLTRKTEVLGVSDFGCNLDDLIFSLVLNESVIEQKINQQLTAYCTSGDRKFIVNSKVRFYKTEERDGALVDIFVNEQRVIGALY